MTSSSDTASDLVARIEAANAGRDPERLAMKYAKMALGPFGFFRACCPLFYDGLPTTPLFARAPLSWSCGDLHFENFGSYKGDNRQVYFDINDFDEACLAPASWDAARLATSIQVGTEVLNTSGSEAAQLSRRCLEAYRAALTFGKPLWVERETADGPVRDLLGALRNRERGRFLDKRTIRKKQLRQLKVDGLKALPASEAQKETVIHFMTGFAASQPDPAFFAVRDVARRIAGTGSLGMERFVVLVEGKGSPDGNYLLDIKQANPAATAPLLARLGLRQENWGDQASRIVAIQKRMQAVDHAFLHAVQIDRRPYVLKGLQASEDRVALGAWGTSLEQLSSVVETMGRVLAWDQLRAAGRAGAANADALMAFAAGDGWIDELQQAAAQMARQNHRQWEVFSASRASQRH